jgi:hypothetical protein
MDDEINSRFETRLAQDQSIPQRDDRYKIVLEFYNCPLIASWRFVFQERKKKKLKSLMSNTRGVPISARPAASQPLTF